MSQIQTTIPDVKAGFSLTSTSYDPLFCKTCQKKGVDDPQPARTLYSDCEKHYRMRIKKLRLTGVYVIWEMWSKRETVVKLGICLSSPTWLISCWRSSPLSHKEYISHILDTFLSCVQLLQFWTLSYPSVTRTDGGIHIFCSCKLWLEATRMAN